MAAYPLDKLLLKNMTLLKGPEVAQLTKPLSQKSLLLEFRLE